MTVVVIVTRPARAGERLFAQVTERGRRAVWWPAFDIEAAPDAGAVRDALARLAEYDLAIFVSASAVRAVRPVLDKAWPADTMIGAVGASTRAAVEAELHANAGLTLIAPDDDSESGSEAFWHAWQASARRAQRVLVLRAEEGREWLGERFIESGAQVDNVAVYSRRPHRLSADDLAQLQEWMADGVQPAVIFSSTEAIAALDRQVAAAARAWLRSGTAIACHARIAQQLMSNGYQRVMNARYDDDSIIAQLELIERKP